MNKKQIETIIKEYINFTIETNNYKSKPLNQDKISFPYEGILCIHDDRDILLQIKDIKIIRGLRL